MFPGLESIRRDRRVALGEVKEAPVFPNFPNRDVLLDLLAHDALHDPARDRSDGNPGVFEWEGAAIDTTVENG